MPIKIIKRGQKRNEAHYKSSKIILTPQDIKEADRFDINLSEEIRKIEKVLKGKVFTSKFRKGEKIWAWYLIGKNINNFLRKNKVSPEEEKIFWDNLYSKFSLVNNYESATTIRRTKNDFKIASQLAKYPYKKVKKIGVWDLWRDIIIHKSFHDERALDWVIQRIEHSTQKRRDDIRPFIRSVAQRLKKIDTSVLSDKELSKKLRVVKWPLKTIIII